ncbi:MAG: ferredoxin--NADP reductase [Casimicrobiaceae bacterium]
MSAWIEGRIAAKKRWTPGLLSLEVQAPEVTFVAGQFARLALPAPAGAKESMIGRPYSFVNAPGSAAHEFYFNVVAEGPFSPRLALLEPGDSLWIAPRANGFFCIGDTAPADVLWCLSTGTGVGPFLSILRTAEPWQKFSRVVLVHAVRVACDLTYRDLMRDLAARHSGAFTYVPVVSRESHPDALQGRIPRLIDDGTLEARAGVALTAQNSHTMLCGNPAMVDDVQAILATRGMKRHRRKDPGHVTVETYW